MSRLGLAWPLEEGETLLWQGRPAPRCYTFRNWKLSAAGTVVFLACSFWMMLGIQLTESVDYAMILVLITLPLVVTTFFLGPGQLLLARWRWEKLFYAVTDQRVMVRDGLLTEQFRSIPLDEISSWQKRSFSENLVSIRLLRGDEAPQILACLEQPQLLLKHLPERQQESGL